MSSLQSYLMFHQCSCMCILYMLAMTLSRSMPGLKTVSDREAHKVRNCYCLLTLSLMIRLSRVSYLS